MVINYFEESENYKPEKVRVLLIGEAPPPSGKTYFYIPREMTNNLPIEKDTSLPATIFHHYFKKRPKTEDEYKALLMELKKLGIFLIDICDEPLRIRDNNGIHRGNLDRLIMEIANLRNKIELRGISIEDKDIIFLLPRLN